MARLVCERQRFSVAAHLLFGQAHDFLGKRDLLGKAPLDAATELMVSYKTVQRWVESGQMSYWGIRNGKRQRLTRRIKVKTLYSPTGYRLYLQSDILKVREFFEGRRVNER